MKTTIITLTDGQVIETPLSVTAVMELKEGAYVADAWGIEVERVGHEPICLGLSSFVSIEGWTE